MNLANTLRLRNLKASAAGAQATVPDSRSSDEWIKNWLDQKNKRLNDLRQELHNLLDYPEPVEIESAYRMDKRSAFPQDPGRVAGHGRWAVVSPEDEIISRWDTKEEADAAAWPAYKGIKPSATGASGGARVKELSAEEEDACDACDTDDCEEECDEEEIDAGGPGSGRHKEFDTVLKKHGFRYGGQSMVGTHQWQHKKTGEHAYLNDSGRLSIEHSYSKPGSRGGVISKTNVAFKTTKPPALDSYLRSRKGIQAADIFQDEELGDKTRAAFLKHEKPEIVKNADILRKGDRRPSSHGQGSAGTGGAGAGGAGGGAGI